MKAAMSLKNLRTFEEMLRRKLSRVLGNLLSSDTYISTVHQCDISMNFIRSHCG